MMAADYRHIGGVENRLGRHYSRFSPFWPAASFADQSLALRKSWNAGSNRRSQVRKKFPGQAKREFARARSGKSNRRILVIREFSAPFMGRPRPESSRPASITH